MMRQQPADQRCSCEDDHQISFVAMANYVGGTTDRLVRRAMRGCPKISDQLIDDRIADAWVFHGL
jgi:hypothetical protein